MTAPDHTTRAVELTTQALDADQGITIRHITVAAAQVEATLALAEAVRGLVPRVDRPRWDDDLRGCGTFTEHSQRQCGAECDLTEYRTGPRGSALPSIPPPGAFGPHDPSRPVSDVTFDHPITVAGTPAEQRHTGGTK